MSSAAERAILRAPVQDLTATTPVGSLPGKEPFKASGRDGFVPSHEVDSGKPAGSSVAQTGHTQTFTAEKSAAVSAVARAGTEARVRPGQRAVATTGDDGDTPVSDSGQLVISIFDETLPAHGVPPRPPGDNRSESTEFSDPDPLAGPRRGLASYICKADASPIRSRGVAEQLLHREVTALERRLALQKQPRDESAELRDANDRLLPLMSANQDQVTGETHDEYVQTMRAGDLALKLYAQAIPDTSSVTANVPVGIPAFIRDLDRQITAARAAQFDVQRLMEIAADETDAQIPTPEVGKRGKEARKADNKTLYRNAEALVRQHADAVERDPVIVDADAKPRGLASIEETGILHLGPMEVTHSGNSVKYNGITFTTKTIHPYGKKPTAQVVPGPQSESMLRITGITVITDTNHTLQFRLSKTALNGDLDFTVEPVRDEETGRRAIHIFPDFPAAERKKLNEILTALINRD